MSEPFDPLHRWLGIPPGEQPPHHYRLLGVTLYEHDLDVIEAAADRCMAYVRQAAVGKYSQHSQPVLNALSTARICLLNPDKKAAYDATLRAQLAPVVLPPQPLPAPVPQPALVTTASGIQTKVKPKITARSKTSAPWLLYVGIGVSALVVGAVAVVVFGRGSTATSVADTSTAKKLPTVAPASTIAPSPPSKPTTTDNNQDKPAINTPAVAVEPASLSTTPEDKASTTPAAEEVAVSIPVLPRRAGERLMFVGEQVEHRATAKVFDKYGLPHESSNFDRERIDYSNIHTIVAGTNAMDYWGGSDARKQPEAFQAIEDFVNAGGHLVVLGAFNGRNMEHMQRFGIKTGFVHCSRFKEVPEHTAVFFKGQEGLIPENRHFQSAGHFSISRPHIVLLDRDDPGRTPGPALATLKHGQGRVTFSMIEPLWQGDLYFLEALAHWIIRGAPTRASDQEHPLPALAAAAGNDNTDTQPDDTPATESPGTAVPKFTRAPVPSPQELTTAEAAIKEVFRDQLKAKTPVEKKLLADTLYKQALEANESPANQYALLQQALEQASQLRDTRLALDCLKELTFRYEHPGATLQVDALTKLAKSARDPLSMQMIVGSALDSTADLLDSNDYAEAAKVSAVAATNASKTQNRLYSILAPAIDKQAKALARTYAKIEPERSALATNPDDPAANLEVGRFYCFQRDQWPQGLAMLAKSSDEPLAKLARQDLAAQKSSEPVDASLGNAWNAIQASLRNEERAAAIRRARYWYQQALAGAQGIQRTEIQNKLAKLPSAKYQLAVHVEGIDGQDELHLTRDSIHWRHLNWELPTFMSLNDLRLDLRQTQTLRNRGASQLLPADLDFSTARIQKVRARGQVNIVPTVDKVIVTIDDSDLGADNYDFIITFGP